MSGTGSAGAGVTCASPGPLGFAAPTFLRGPVFVAATCTLAVAAHVAGNGAVPDLAHILAAVLVATLGWAPACDHQHGALQAIARVAAVQVALHVVLAQTLAAADATSSPHAMSSSMSSWMSGPSMWAAHAVAVVLLALWLVRGERAAWRALARAAVLLFSPALPWRPAISAQAPIQAPAPKRYRCPALPSVGLRAPPVSA